MDELIQILERAVPELVEGGNYQVHKVHAGHSMCNASLTIAKGSLFWRVVRDRSQVFLECRWLEGRPDRWYTIDLLRTLISEERVDSAVLDDANASWLSNHFRDVESRFEPERVRETLDSLRALKTERAKRLFG